MTILTAPFGASCAACGTPERSAPLGEFCPRSELGDPDLHDFSTSAQATSALPLPGAGVVCGDGRDAVLEEAVGVPALTTIEGGA